MLNRYRNDIDLNIDFAVNLKWHESISKCGKYQGIAKYSWYWSILKDGWYQSISKLG